MAMSPTLKMPPVAAFRLLSDLNEFIAHSPEERQSILDVWVDALDRRTPMLEALEADRDAAAVDRAAAGKAKGEAEETVLAIVSEAQDRGRGIVDAATEQAESVNKTVAENVAKAQSDADTAASEAQERETREANAFKEREDAVKLREDAVEGLERAAQVVALDAAAVKAEYETLIEGINALQRRAPK